MILGFNLGSLKYATEIISHSIVFVMEVERGGITARIDSTAVYEHKFVFRPQDMRVTQQQGQTRTPLAEPCILIHMSYLLRRRSQINPGLISFEDLDQCFQRLLDGKLYILGRHFEKIKSLSLLLFFPFSF
jgi:hypothetical protein